MFKLDRLHSLQFGCKCGPASQVNSIPQRSQLTPVNQYLIAVSYAAEMLLAM